VHACLSQRVRLVLSMVLLSAPALVLQATGQIAAAAGAAASVSPCGPNQVFIGLAPGLPGMHRVTVLIEVRDTSRHPCALVGLPAVSALESNGRIGETAGGSPLESASTRTSRSSLTLDPGETASAQVVAISPVAPTTSCPSYPELSVSLWSSGPSRVFKQPLPGCSPGFSVTSFVPGFNGTSPTGELVGTAPVCKPPTRSAMTSAAAVEVDVWSGRTLAGSTTVFATNAPKSYQIVLAPGRYLVTSSHTRSRRVTVKLGRTENVGTFGGCSILTTQTTIPGRGAVTTTTRPASATSADRLTKIAFLNSSVGYGLFIRQGTATCQAVVASTTDGGAVFGSLTAVTSWACPNAAPASQLAFDDHGDGFLYGPALFVTHDSGATWTQLPQAGVVLSVEALGSSVWAVETSCPTPSTFQQPCPLRLLESTDGGRSWDTVPAPSTARSAGLATGQTYLIRLTTGTAYLASNPPFTGEGSSATAPLWFTGNGGRTWSAREVDCGIGSLMDAISAAPDGTLVAVCASQPSAGSQPKSTVRSTNGGRTWTTTTPCPHSSSLTFGCTITQPLSFGYLGEIDAVTGATVFLVGGRSSLLVTHDGGVSWHVVHPVIGDTSDGSWDVSFFNRLDGVVLGSNPQDAEAVSIWSTSDGGTTWRSVVPTESPATTDSSFGFAATSASFTSTRLGWVLGISPCGKNLCTSVVHTTDGGNTWQRVKAPPAPVNSSTRTGVSELHFANDLDGYAFGGSALWVTHDGGAHWRDQLSLAGIKPYVVGSLVSTTTGVFALVAGYRGQPGLGLGGENAAWRLVHATTRSDRFRVVATLSGTTGVPLSGALAGAGGTVYAIDADSLLRVDATTTTSYPLPPGQDCEGPLTASSASDVLLVCGFGVADGSMGDRELFGTTDGGRTWVRLADPGRGAGYDTLGIADGGDGHVAISTVSAGGGALLVTTDFGNSWTESINISSGDGAPFTDLSYLGPSQAIAVYGPAQAPAIAGRPLLGVGSVYETVDGGLTWTKMSL